MKHPSRPPSPRTPLLLLVCAALLPVPAVAQRVSSIVTDASTHDGKPIVLQGPQYLIPEALGRLAGRNLFHSFQRFGLASGESATFTTQTAALDNVIARVTGGQVSQLQGLLSLQAAGGAPAFFLINPAGVVFGDGARIDVPGAFHASTAPRLRFAGGESLDTTQADSQFSAAAPEAFGFLGAQRAAALQVLGDAQLVGADGAALSLSAGDLLLTGERAVASGGLRLVAVGSRAAELSLQAALPEDLDGSVGIGAGMRVGVVTPGAQDAGALQLHAGSLFMGAGAALLSQTRQGSSGAGGDLSIRLADELQMFGGAYIETLTGTAAAGGKLTLSARQADLSEGAYLQTTSVGAGRGGDLDLRVTQSLSLSGEASLYGASFGDGDGGSLRAQAGRMDFSQGGYVQVVARSAGRGGALTLLSDGDLSMSSGAAVLNTLEGSGAGRDTSVSAGGRLQLTGSRITQTTLGSGATGLLRLQAAQIELLDSRVNHASLEGGGNTGATQLLSAGALLLDGSEVRATTESGRTGDFLLQGQDLRLQGGSLVLNSAQGAGAQAGNVTLQAAGSLGVSASGVSNLGLADGQAGNVLLLGGELTVTEASRLFTSSIFGDSRAGDLTLRGLSRLRVDGNSLIAANTFGNRDAGAILLEAPVIELSGASLSSATFEGGGHAGSITLTAQQLLSLQASVLNSSTSSAGNAGRVELRAQDIDIGTGSLIASAIAAQGTGQGGAIHIEAGRDLRVTGQSGIDSASNNGSGEGGSVFLKAGRELLLNDSRVSSNAQAQGRGGTVELEAQTLRIEGNAVVASDAQGGTGDAGSVSMRASRALHLIGVDVNSVTASAGDAGAILLQAPEIVIDANAKVLASVFQSASGAGGEVRVLAGDRLVVQGGSRIDSSSFGTGAAGRILLDSGGSLSLLDRALVSSATIGAAPAGTIALQAAGLLRIEGGSHIEGSTFGSGAAGSLVVQGAEVRIGNAFLNSSTFGAGAAGQIEVQARGLLELGAGALIGAVAGEESGGQTGNIALMAAERLIMQGSEASISNVVTVADPAALRPTVLSLMAPVIELQSAKVSATATGNANASRIEIKAGERLDIKDSLVITSANDGDGGDLSASAGRAIKLENSGLITSVLGTEATGDGGDILVQTELLVMDKGFIQANTAAAGARGGNVRIDVAAVVPVGGRLMVGGDRPLEFIPEENRVNVIQAAAPDGVSGNVAVTSQIDLAAALALLERRLLDAVGLGRGPCDRVGGSSLGLSGRGGLPSWLGVPGVSAATERPSSPTAPKRPLSGRAPGVTGDCA